MIRRHLRSAAALLAFTACWAVLLVPSPASAATRNLSTVALKSPTDVVGYDGSVWGDGGLWNWAQPDQFEVTDLGRAVVVTRLVTGTLWRQTYTTDGTRRLTNRSVALPGDLIPGGVLVGPDGSTYVLYGLENDRESAEAPWLVVRKYDPHLRLLGKAVLNGKPDGLGVTRGIDATAPSMTLVGGRLVVHLARQTYTQSDGARHQVNLTVDVDTRTMKHAIVSGGPYSSHSFRQDVRTVGSGVAFLDHGDAYPRALQLAVMDTYRGPNDHSTARKAEILDIPGNLGDNFTGVTVNGFEVGSGRALTTGVKASEPSHLRNVYLLSSRLSDGATRFQQITRYSPTDPAVQVTQPALVKLAEDRFALMYGVKRSGGFITVYKLLNPQGDVLATTLFRGSAFTAVSDPVKVGKRILWVGYSRTSGERNVLMGLNIGNRARPTELTR